MPDMYLKSRCLLLVIFSMTLFVRAYSQLHPADLDPSKASAAKNFLDWLKEGDSVTLVLKTDFGKFKKERLHQEYQPATLTLQNGSFLFRQEAKIRTRGRYRCQRCDVPPIKLKIKKKEMLNAGFQEWNEFKLVLPCKKGREYEQLVLKEYLTYRLYNIITDRSFRVRRLRLRIVDSKRREAPFVGTAFLIEHTEETEYRLGGKEIESNSFDPKSFSQTDYTRMQVFQYMIGNTDWMPVAAHNLKVIALSDSTLVPVPYDFDFSGLVDAEYAVPNPRTGLTSIQSRVFMADDKSKEEMDRIFFIFKEKKNEMISLIARFDALDFRERKQMIRYLQSFYKKLDNPRVVQREFFEKTPFASPLY